MRLAQRLQFLGTESSFEMLARARALEGQGRDIIHLEIGEPDFDTPSHISQAAIQALDEGYTHYGPAQGLPELREEIARSIKETLGVEVGPERVVVTPGAKPILFYTLMALVEPGDEVVYTNPGFPIYESLIHFCGAKAIPLRFQLEEDRFVLDLEDLAPKINERTKLVILNFPQNPTGATLNGVQLEQLANLLQQSEAIVLSDEIYSQIIYEGSHLSIAAVPGFLDRTVILNGFSKTYAMTGWRLGYGVLPEFLVEHVVRLVVNSVSCASTFIQRAAIQALAGPQEETHEMVEEFRQRRDLVVKGLRQIPGVTCATPGGSFYVFPNIEGTGISSDEFSNRCLMEAGVALLSGASFGSYGDGYVRLSFANSRENLTKALDRIGGFVRGLRS